MEKNNKRDETGFLIGFVPLFYDPTFACKRRYQNAAPAPTGAYPAWEDMS
jgi:hypothetical protein